MFRVGQEIGNYILIKKLGRGGFGEVWMAERRAKFATTQVAVKLPLDEQVDHAAIEHEAQLWVKASGHSNILPIIEANEYDGQVVIVSEYAPDGSLEEWLKINGKMLPEKAAKMTVQILDGLEFLHARKIIHRDLKPANILLQGNTPRLADFGISRALRTTIGESQNISGTFAYMSPEALDGKRSVQTDIWSVGVNLYQFLTGMLPFPQKEPSKLFSAIMTHEFEPLPDFVPPGLQHIIWNALIKLPENRYKSADRMREDLQHYLNGDSGNIMRFPAETVLPTERDIAVKKPANSDSVITSVKVNAVNEDDSGEEFLIPSEFGFVVPPNPAPIPPPPRKISNWLISGAAVLALGTAYVMIREPEEKPIITPTPVVQISPNNLTALDYSKRGYECGEKNDNDCAIANYTKAISLDASDWTSYNNRGVSHKRKVEFDLAMADYNKAIAIKPDFATAYDNRGNLYVEKGDYDKAISDYRQALMIEPNNKQIQEHLNTAELRKVIKDALSGNKLNPQ